MFTDTLAKAPHPASLIPYHYEAFSDKESIRVLTLFPSKLLSAEIHIKLSIVRLIDNPGYEALSYTWGTINGDASLCSTIYCDGGQIKVTRNCEDALRRLRREDAERILWVDAICINQKNDEEKAHQVAFMGSIYQHAAQAVIWLGDASEAVDEETGQPLSDLFFEYLAPMAAEMQQQRSNGYGPSTSPLYQNLAAQAADYVANKNLTPLVQGFLDVILRPWWDRVWVVQEAALAQSASVICGGKTADYSQLFDLWHTCFTDVEHDSGLTYSLLEGYKHHMISVHNVREYPRFLGPAKILQGVLDRCRRLRATDRRDHIFAMLDMFGDFKSKLPAPDYSKSPPEVFTDMTRIFLDHLDSLEILTQATNVEFHPEFPSWAVDFSQRPKFHISVADDVYHASCDSPAFYKISNDGKELQLLGVCVDVLETVPKAPIEGYYNPYIPVKAILGYQQSVRVGRSMADYPTGEDPEEVLWRTMCWNIDGESNCPATNETGIPFEHFSRALVSEKDVEVVEKEILLKDACGFNDICVHSMPLCITEDKYLASVPWTAEKGDRIVIFSGGQLPFVLRRRPMERHFRFIGACYVHGIMQGEAFPDDPEELEWFSIR